MLLAFVLLLVCHFVGDFLLQSDRMALNKSKRMDWLIIHVSVYILAFLPWIWWMGDQWSWGLFLVVTWVTHCLTDAVTSRATSKLWFLEIAQIDWPNEVTPRVLYQVKPGNLRHWFFVMIGLDQLIHTLTLAATLLWLA